MIGTQYSSVVYVSVLCLLPLTLLVLSLSLHVHELNVELEPGAGRDGRGCTARPVPAQSHGGRTVPKAPHCSTVTGLYHLMHAMHTLQHALTRQYTCTVLVHATGHSWGLTQAEGGWSASACPRRACLQSAQSPENAKRQLQTSSRIQARQPVLPSAMPVAP